MIALSERTIEHVRALFRSDDVAEAQRLLIEECGATVPALPESPTPANLERIRFSALRLSAGELAKLRAAIELAHTDWRDLLVSADFADDIHAHLAWRP